MPNASPMLDIKFIREHAEEVKENARKRHVTVDIDELLRVDAERLALLKEVEDLRRERNETAEKIPSVAPEAKPGLIEHGKEVKQLIAVKESELAEAEERWMGILLEVPNMTHPDSPVGATDEENVPIRTIGEPTKIKDPKDHVQIGKELDILDFDRAAEVSGAKFYYLKGKLAILEQSLIRFALDCAMENGFTPVTTPDVARDEVLRGTGFIPRGNESQIYSIENSDLSLIGTAEITLSGLHMGQAIDEDKLPIRYVGFSHCYRTEAGAYGRESYGLYRVHQFSKVELYVYAAPEQSEALHAELLRIEEDIWTKLGIPFHVVDICTGDLGGPAYRKYDLEAWMPGKASGKGKGAYGEVTSASNCTDFQARRLGIKVKRKSGTVEFLHTLNGTAIATSRAMIAILENGQQEDGSVIIPKVLVPYCGFERIG
jgi:seryl-tRNA synthetase